MVEVHFLQPADVVLVPFDVRQCAGVTFDELHHSRMEFIAALAFWTLLAVVLEYLLFVQAQQALVHYLDVSGRPRFNRPRLQVFNVLPYR